MATDIVAITLALVLAVVTGLAVRFGGVMRRRRRFRPLAPELERLAAEPSD